MPSVREIIDALLNEIKAVLREYVHETEAALKKRVQRLLITGIIVSVLLALVIALIGSASIFILIGSLKYQHFHAGVEGLGHHGSHFRRYWRTAHFGAYHHHKESIEIPQVVYDEANLSCEC